MWGPPKEVEGKCNATLEIGDDYGDNACTMRCQLDKGHSGDHEEKFLHDGETVVVTWKTDDRSRDDMDEEEVETVTERLEKPGNSW